MKFHNILCHYKLLRLERLIFLESLDLASPWKYMQQKLLRVSLTMPCKLTLILSIYRYTEEREFFFNSMVI